MIKGFVLGILITVFMCIGVGARTFTDIKGRQIEADLVAHSGEKIVLSRAGKKFLVPITMFAPPDQAYIKEWIEANPGKIDVDYKFRFYADCKTNKSTRQKDGAAYDDKLKFHDNLYEMIVYNNGQTEVMDVTIRYEIFVADYVVIKGNKYAAMAYGAEKSEKLEVIAGSHDVKSIPVKGRFDFERDFSTEFYIDRDGGVTDEAAQDKVIGVMIRVYKGDQVLAEHSHSMDDKRVGKIVWQDKKPGKQER